MRFKTDTIAAEFDQLLTHNPKLRKLLQLLDGYCVIELGKDICVTDIYRTQAEQDALYAPAKAPASVHTIWRGADVRSTDFTDAELTKILGFLNYFTYRGTAGKKVALVHSVGTQGVHAHIQYF